MASVPSASLSLSLYVYIYIEGLYIRINPLPVPLFLAADHVPSNGQLRGRQPWVMNGKEDLERPTTCRPAQGDEFHGDINYYSATRVITHQSSLKKYWITFLFKIIRNHKTIGILIFKIIRHHKTIGLLLFNIIRHHKTIGLLLFKIIHHHKIIG